MRRDARFDSLLKRNWGSLTQMTSRVNNSNQRASLAVERISRYLLSLGDDFPETAILRPDNSRLSRDARYLESSLRLSRSVDGAIGKNNALWAPFHPIRLFKVDSALLALVRQRAVETPEDWNLASPMQRVVDLQTYAGVLQRVGPQIVGGSMMLTKSDSEILRSSINGWPSAESHHYDGVQSIPFIIYGLFEDAQPDLP